MPTRSYDLEISMDTTPPNAVVIRGNADREPGEHRNNRRNRGTVAFWCGIASLILAVALIATLICVYRRRVDDEDISLPFVPHNMPDMDEVVHEHQHIVHQKKKVVHEIDWMIPEKKKLGPELPDIIHGQVRARSEGSLESPRNNHNYSALIHQIKANGLEVIPGPFLACVKRGLKLNCADEHDTIKGVLEWEVGAIVNELSERREKLDAKNEVDVLLAYKRFITVNGSHYASDKEYVQKYFNFRNTKKLIDAHNSIPNKLYTMAYSWASEYSDSELGIALSTHGWSKPMYMYENGTFIDTSMYSGSKKVDDSDVIHKDWRDVNAIGPVVDQGTCGSCWAIAVAGLVDSYRAITTGERLMHSAQQILDCTSQTYNCVRGGSQEKALTYAATKGLCIEPAYPYSGKKTACRERSCGEKFHADNIIRLDASTIEEHLRKHGPVMIIMRLSRAFLHYSSGIFDGSCDSPLMHSVLVVGFGENIKRKAKYWIVKNSWGNRWGEGGYFKLHSLPLSPSGSPLFCDVDTYAFGLTTD
ncbi:Papain family cysteine protease family member protein [Babesia ovata]|uniref:Papain family cysteine protease family member protein n=1 Tax=Babesia ovata TaxID=189622 RepID=A0A2H6KDA5_9APIC|nr:Papain family cysteine protease family member protein [Babesia ovata]GBE60971.1 Papain family cysteine protease family member protein [Babesia ovata]